MPRLWLRCAVRDSSTRRILDRWDDEPLPGDLRLPQLRSYLIQRFGPLLANSRTEEWPFVHSGPPLAAKRPSLLLVAPLVMDPDGRGLVPVASQLQRLQELASDLGVGRTIDLTAVARGEAWTRPLFEVQSIRQSAHDAAARAARAWLLAEGLATQVEAIRAVSGVDPVPAPGLAGLREDVARSAQTAATRADRAQERAEAVEAAARAVSAGTGGARARIGALRREERRFLALCDAVVSPAEEAERSCRALAQLVLGVNSVTRGSDEAYRLDRAAVGVLHPPDGQGAKVGLLEDGVALASRSKDELVVELSGLLCRLLLDRGIRLVPRCPGTKGTLEVEVDAKDTLVARLRLPDSAAKPLAAARKTGWSGARTDGCLSDRWPSPVTILGPSKRIVDTLSRVLGLERVAQLRTRVEPIEAR